MAYEIIPLTMFTCFLSTAVYIGSPSLGPSYDDAIDNFIDIRKKIKIVIFK